MPTDSAGVPVPEMPGPRMWRGDRENDFVVAGGFP